MYNEINYLYLKKHKIFAGLTKEQLYEVLKHTKFSRKRKSDVIRLSENEKPKLYFLIKGRVKIAETDNLGNFQIKEVEKAGGVFVNFGKSNPKAMNMHRHCPTRRFTFISTTGILICCVNSSLDYP